MTDWTGRWLGIDHPHERVARITLRRPPVNALGSEMAAELALAAKGIADEPTLCAVLLAADGAAFCAGADLKERAGKTDDEVLAHNQLIREAVEAVAAIPVPTIAAVHGAALGGGFELALACDLRIAAADARVGLPECARAIIPGAGGTQRLPRVAGYARAARWIFTAHYGTGSEAAADGLVEFAVPAAEVGPRALALAVEMTECGPLALRAAKRALREGLYAGGLDAALAIERTCYLETLETADRREGIDAFNAKRPPRYRGQ